MSPYPIIERRVLQPTPARFMRPRRRELSALPVQPGGTLLVASVGEHWELFDANAVTPTTHVFVQASSIAVVDVRPTTVTVALSISSATTGRKFTVNVAFACKVTDAAQVASGGDDIAENLKAHLLRDKKIDGLGADISADQLVEFERQATARITAWCMGRPPRIPGMLIELGYVEVLTPPVVAQHADQLAAERRRQELEELRIKFSRERAQGAREEAALIEVVLKRGPEAIEALFLELNDDRYARSAERAYGEREITELRLRELIGMLAERGQFDRVAVDTPRLLNEFVDSLLHSRSRRLSDGSQPGVVLGAAPPAGAVGAGTGSDDDGDRDSHSDRPSDPPEDDVLDG
jgi:hypothetical protein